MTLPDIINGIFEFGIGVFQYRNVQLIRKQREIKGVHWSITAWTSIWGLYNLYYYPSLSQWFSFSGGILIATMNITWLAHALYYEGDINWRPPFVPPKALASQNMPLNPFKKTQAI